MVNTVNKSKYRMRSENSGGRMKITPDLSVGQLKIYIHCGTAHARGWQTSRGGQMSRVATSRSGRSGNLKVSDSNLDITLFKPWSCETND